MYKKIERQESTTYVLESYFHYIKDENELNNIMNAYKDHEFILERKWIDETSFQPMLAFYIRKKDQTLFESFKYIASIEMLQDLGITKDTFR